MSMYCFYCDRAVDGDTCPTCGRPTWQDTSGEQPELPSESPVPLEPGAPWRPKPWMIAGTVVAVGLVLSILTVPSGFQQVTPPIPPPTISTTTTTFPDPDASLPTYPMPRGTWLGLIGPGSPPRTLTGTFPFLKPADDVLYDGSLLVHDPDAYIRITPDGLSTNLPTGSPAQYVDAMLAPNGRQLATVDTHGLVVVWDLISGQSTELETTGGADPLTDGHLYWSPSSTALGLDVRGEYAYTWATDGTLLAGPLPGRLVAVGSSRLAIIEDDGLRLKDPSGELANSFGPLYPTVFSAIQAGAFDPTGRYLAVDATNGQESGVWVIDLTDPNQELVAPSGSSFVWSGDGSALYWSDETGTYAYPVSSLYRVATVSGQGMEPGDHLRVYDPALVGAPSLLVRGGDLYELRDGKIVHRTVGGLDVIDPQTGGLTTSILDGTPLNPDLPLIRTVHYEGDGTLALQVSKTGQLETVIGDLGPDTAVASMLNAPAIGVFLSTTDGEVLRAGADLSLDPILEGTSPGIVGSVPFAATADSIERLPREGDAPETLLERTGLTGAGEILDAIGIRSEMIVLARSLVGVPSLYWVPGDSTLFGTAIVPNSPIPNATPFSLVYVPTSNRAFDTGWIIPSGDGQTFALALQYEDGMETVVMIDPNPGKLTCGGQVVCQAMDFEGTPLGFSPDGAWLLTATDQGYFAVSTKGRGIVRLDDAPPDQVAWIP